MSVTRLLDTRIDTIDNFVKEEIKRVEEDGISRQEQTLENDINLKIDKCEFGLSELKENFNDLK